MASLEFTDCTGKKPSENKAKADNKGKYVRANFRHDAGIDARRTTPDCLVYLGATGSMQFFLAYSEDSASEALGDPEIQSAPSVVVILNSGDRAASGPTPPPPDLETTPSFSVIVDGRSGAVSAQRCKLDLKAVVGPFETGKSENFDQDKKVRHCSVPGIPKSASLAPSELDDAIKKITDGSDSGELLVLVGRADIRPINNSSSKSNMELAQNRAEWVQEQLSKKLHRNMSVLSIVAGPSDTGVSDDPCSRVVEIYSCTIQGMEASDSDGGM